LALNVFKISSKNDHFLHGTGLAVIARLLKPLKKLNPNPKQKMKKILLNSFSIMAAMLLWTACSEENIYPKDSTSSSSSSSTDASAKKGSPNSTSSASDYTVSLSTNGTTWTYTITRNPRAKALSHFIVDLNNCGDESASLADVLSATVNGVAVALQDTEGSGTGCAMTSTNFIKFDNLDNSAVYVLSFELDRAYETFSTATGWVKAGTSCNTITLPAPGCPVTEACSMSQGFYFGNGVYNNGAAELWTNGVTLGGNTYSLAEGTALWDAKGVHKYGVVRAFFQYSAIQLSGADVSGDADVAAAVAAIDAYFATISKLTAANAATVNGGDMGYYAGVIGNWIDNNHCGE
jgi:hypothetical protein